MDYVYTALVSFAAGVVVTKLYFGRIVAGLKNEARLAASFVARKL